MPKFNVTVYEEIEYTFEVEADSREAIEKLVSEGEYPTDQEVSVRERQITNLKEITE